MFKWENAALQPLFPVQKAQKRPLFHPPENACCPSGKNQNLKNSEVVNFPLDIDGYKVYNADYNNVTMR